MLAGYRKRGISGRAAMGAFGAVVISAAIGCSSSASSSGAGAQPKQTLSLEIDTLSVANMQDYLSLVDGAFAKYNLDVSITTVDNSIADAGIVSGRYDLANSTPGTLLSLTKAGQNTAALYLGTSNQVPATVVGTPGISSVADCKTWVTLSPTSTSYAWAKEYEQLYKTTFSIESVGTAALETDALLSGRADCANGAAGYWNQQIAAHQLVVLVDPTKTDALPANYPSPSIGGLIWGLTATVKAHSSAVTAFFNAINWTLNNTMKQDSPAQLASMLLEVPDFKTFTRASLIAQITALKPYAAPYGGVISEGVWNNTMSFVRQTGLTYADPSQAEWSYAQRVDMTYAK
jgi:hypothetical protein